MITQIEIDGFKTFKDFKVELAPFQVIVGANGSGKSNLFDALQLLGRLASHDLLEAFQELRGRAGEQFTKISEQTAIRRMRFAVELLLDRFVQSETIKNAVLEYTRLRYEIEITHIVSEIGPDQLFVSYEELKSIPRYKDSWLATYKVPHAFLPTAELNEEIPFIETNSQHDVIVVYGAKRNTTGTFFRTGDNE
jgi:AAA15 family ATPase/GTPase